MEQHQQKPRIHESVSSEIRELLAVNEGRMKIRPNGSLKKIVGKD